MSITDEFRVKLQDPTDKEDQGDTYLFDRCFPLQSDQPEVWAPAGPAEPGQVYEATAKALVSATLEGYNGTMLACPLARRQSAESGQMARPARARLIPWTGCLTPLA